MKRKQHAIDIVFILSLFCVFAVLALFVVVLGANVYRNLSGGMEENGGVRTSVAYLTEKVRQGDLAAGVELAEVDGSDALVFPLGTENGEYETWIYVNGGMLREITVAAGEAFDPPAGQPIMELESMELRAGDGGLLSIDVRDASGKEWRSAVCRKSGGQE